MKDGKLKKNSFTEGTIITSIALILIKILGAFYVIPFYKIIGTSGGTLYSYAYNIYSLFLNISTAGIPIAMSMIISEYLALNMLDAKERSYKIGKKLVAILGIVAFSICFFASDLIAKFILSDITGGHTIKEVSLVIKAISPCLLIIPFLSVLRGYMQGHKFIVPTSYAQLLEQVVRIFVVILASYVSINVFKTSISTGVALALSGTFFGGLSAFIYLKRKVNKNKSSFSVSKVKDKVKNNVIVKKIIMYCLPIVLIAISDNIYTIVDIKLIIKGLNMIGFSAIDSEMISGIVSTWSPKICAIIISISIALTTNIIPHVTSNFIKKDMKGVNYRINQALSTMFIIIIPMSIILFLLSKEAYYIFYGSNNYGYLILKFSILSHVFLGINSVLNSSLQSMKKFKIIYISSFTGLVSNAILDIPMILLFNKIGFAPYVATIVCTCIGYIISISISYTYLRKNMGFEFKDTRKVLKKLIIPSICIILIISISKYFISIDLNKITAFFSLAIYGMISIGIYFIITNKNKAISDVFKEDFINNILIKLHLKKK